MLNFIILDGTEASIETKELAGIANVTVLGAKSPTGADISAEQLKDADVIGVWHTIFLDEAFIAEKISPRTKLVARYGAGYDNCDGGALAKRGIALCPAPDYGTEEVADSAMSHILNLYRQTAELTHFPPNSAQPSRATPFQAAKGPDAIAAAAARIGGAATCCRRIRGETLGVVGCGRIGSALVARAKAFGFARILIYDPFLAPGWEKALGVERVPALHDLLKVADCVTLHAAVTPTSRGIIGAAELAVVKPNAFLVNTARGELINEPALRAALVEGRIAAASLDTIIAEPFSQSHVLYGAPNLFVTPHSAWYSRESRVEMRTICCKHVKELARQLSEGVQLADLKFAARVN